MNKTRFIGFRVTESEYERLASNARSLSITPSAYLRFLINLPIAKADVLAQMEEPDKRIIAIHEADLGPIRLELAREGNNLNQAAFALNALKKKPYMRMDVMQERTKDALDRIERSHSMLSEISRNMISTLDRVHTSIKKR